MYTYNKWVLTNDKSIPSKSEETFSLTLWRDPLWLGENGSLHLAHADTTYLYGRWYQGTVRWQTLARVTFILSFHIVWYYT